MVENNSELDGIPNVDLSPIVNQLRQETNEAKPEQKPAGVESTPFKKEEDLVKGYKEIQGFATKVSQENKALKEEMARLQEERNIANIRPVNATPSMGEFDVNTLIDKPREVISSVIQEQLIIKDTAEILEEEINKVNGNTVVFQNKYNVVRQISNDPRYSHLTKSKAGVRKMFEMAGKYMEQSMKTNARQALETLIGGPVDDEGMAKFSEMIRSKKQQQQTSQQANNAYMPEVTMGTHTVENQKISVDTDIKNAVDKGDVDAVLQGLFKKALAK